MLNLTTLDSISWELRICHRVGKGPDLTCLFLEYREFVYRCLNIALFFMLACPRVVFHEAVTFASSCASGICLSTSFVKSRSGLSNPLPDITKIAVLIANTTCKRLALAYAKSPK